MKILEFAINAIKDGFDVNRRNIRELREQPFMKELWIAQDSALRVIFHDLNDEQLNAMISNSAKRMFEKLVKKHKVPEGQEAQYEELSLRNARRITWSAYTMTHADFSEEMSPVLARYIAVELENMGVLEQYHKQYPQGIISTDPVEPYF